MDNYYNEIKLVSPGSLTKLVGNYLVENGYRGYIIEEGKKGSCILRGFLKNRTNVLALDIDPVAIENAW
ncbi:MAG: hypothetical protein OEV55_05535 [candidate division Zixibacteria bacterium]|nr:hypothetical protein [candidate division Zixibacteria bacterium]